VFVLIVFAQCDILKKSKNDGEENREIRLVEFLVYLDILLVLVRPLVRQELEIQQKKEHLLIGLVFECGLGYDEFLCYYLSLHCEFGFIEM